MSQAHVPSPVDEAAYLRGEETAAARFEQELSADDRVDVACDGTRRTLTLDDLYEDTGLLVV
ncbi:MAG: hypothetical protein WA146_10675 [Thiobacillus sp.]|nr:hypothetical protein [Thiobacillus sp.]